jgi:hypothetical protein
MQSKKVCQNPRHEKRRDFAGEAGVFLRAKSAKLPTSRRPTDLRARDAQIDKLAGMMEAENWELEKMVASIVQFQLTRVARASAEVHFEDSGRS